MIQRRKKADQLASHASDLCGYILSRFMIALKNKEVNYDVKIQYTLQRVLMLDPADCQSTRTDRSLESSVCFIASLHPASTIWVHQDAYSPILLILLLLMIVLQI